MSRGLNTRFSRLSTEDDSRVAIKQEVSDRKLKQESASSKHVGIKRDELDEPNLLYSVPQFPGYRSDDNDNNAAIEDEGGDNVIKHENRTTKKRARTSPPRAPTEYHWDDAIADATIHARKLGITELPPGKVGRVVEYGEMTGIFPLDPTKNVQNFIVYDALEILARVEDYEMETAVHELAALHIGERLHWNHPHAYELAVSSVPMKGRLAGGFAVKICAMAEEPAKKRKGPGHKSRA